MAKIISKFIFWLTGWKVVGGFPPEVRQAVMVAAPHTSNWDFLYARCAFFIMGVPLKFTIKKEVMFFPLGPILTAMGAIAIDRKAGMKRNKEGKSTVQAMADLYKEHEQLVIIVTPEATRKYQPKWKTGFYHVAELAQVPIVMGYLDYDKKHAGVGPVFNTTGKMEADIEQIKDFYRSKKAKYPQNGIR